MTIQTNATPTERTAPSGKPTMFDLSKFEAICTPEVTPIESGSVEKTIIDRSGHAARTVPNPALWGVGPFDTLTEVNVIREGGGALLLHVKREVCEVHEAGGRVCWSRYRCESRHSVAPNLAGYATRMLEGLAGGVPIRYASEAQAITPPAARSWFAI
ncbi:hypothetical protein [Burkholderia gladioli]|uniref:hypothetical protein n=1 Tax=Burkholderia gladioli TaxID=28095 RepID=UPI001641EF25|nr:hypothetical protein [Burkholderia gladioli]